MPVVAGANAGSIAAYRAGRYQVLPLPAAEVDVVRADPEFGRQLLDTPRLSLISLQRRPGATSSLAGGLSPSQVTALAAGKSGQTADALVPVGMPGDVPNVAHFAPAPVRGETVTLTKPAGATETSTRTPLYGCCEREPHRILHARLALPGGGMLYAGDAPAHVPYEGIKGVSIAVDYDASRPPRKSSPRSPTVAG